jgi:hypothetical protein
MAAKSHFLRRRTVLAAAVAAIGLSGANCALAQPELVDFKVVDRDSGKTLRVWRHHGRFFVAGEPGRRYALRVTNHTGERVLVVMSVDGVNVLTGETAGYDQQGYVFAPYQSWDLTGWRKSNTQVAAFVFAPLPQSYAARTGRPADVGVIGLAVFREKAAPPPVVTDDRSESDGVYGQPSSPRYAPAPPPPDARTVDKAEPSDQAARAASEGAAGARLARRDDKLGTGHGAREWSEVHTVDFERATAYPAMIQQIEYDTYDNLVLAGVIRTAEQGHHRPRPFPSRPDDGEGYVPDPPPEF